MLSKKQIEREEKRISGVQKAKENRIKKAAVLSRTRSPIEICRTLGIDPRTLKRYGEDPLWSENGGVELPSPLYIKKAGRLRDLKKEREQIAEVRRLRDLRMKWGDIAKQIGLTRRQLEHLRSKYPC